MYSGDIMFTLRVCSHYQNPTEARAAEGHDAAVAGGNRLNLASVLTWGPCYYYQKAVFFRVRIIRSRTGMADAY